MPRNAVSKPLLDSLTTADVCGWPSGPRTESVVVEYWTIEVLDGELSALHWRDAYGALSWKRPNTNLVVDSRWTVHPSGVALERGFAEDDHWVRFRALPVVRAALDAVRIESPAL